MFHSGMPLRFWPYSILTATWLINRIPSRFLDWKSPYELLFGNPLYYTMLRPFGCLAYAANLVPHRGKFDSRSIKCVFIGYDISHKEFLLFDLQNEIIFISRDVKFVTDKFPFLQVPTTVTEPVISYPRVGDPPSIDVPPMDADDYSSDHDFPIIEFQSPETVRTPSPTVHQPEEPTLRRGTRHREPPVWMQDYTG